MKDNKFLSQQIPWQINEVKGRVLKMSKYGTKGNPSYFTMLKFANARNVSG